MNEDLARLSVRYAVQVFRESFIKSAAAGRMGLPSVPLSELYSSAIEYIRARGGQVLLRASVTAIEHETDGVSRTVNSCEQQFDCAVLAVAFQTEPTLCPSDGLDGARGQPSA